AIDLSSGSGGAQSALDAWRGGGPAAEKGWNDAGVRPRPLPIPPKRAEGDGQYTEGLLVRHATYGPGRIVEGSGHGELRKAKIRFTTAGERSFIADKVKLEVLRK